MVPIPPPHPPLSVMRWQLQIERAAAKYSLPPEFIAAVIDRETNGENVVGDHGHGRGLMQIDDRYHGDWLREHDGGLDPDSNIDYGASILAANLHQAQVAGLTDDAALKFAASAFNAGLTGALVGLRAGDSDIRTANGDYGTDVLRRMHDKFESASWSGGDIA